MQQKLLSKTWAMRLVEAQQGELIERSINRLYHERGLTLEETAARLGVSKSALSRWMVTLGIPTRPAGPEPKEAA